jgi:hypothetical protein
LFIACTVTDVVQSVKVRGPGHFFRTSLEKQETVPGPQMERQLEFKNWCSGGKSGFILTITEVLGKFMPALSDKSR